MRPWEIATYYVAGLALIATALGLVVIFYQAWLMERQTTLARRQLRVMERQDAMMTEQTALARKQTEIIERVVNMNALRRRPPRAWTAST
jgi:hypothetical protein